MPPKKKVERGAQENIQVRQTHAAEFLCSRMPARNPLQLKNDMY